MLFAELLSGFLYSRRHGIRESGARSKSSEKTVQNYEFFLKTFFDFMENQRGRSKWDSLTREDVRGYIEFLNGNAEWSENTKITYLRSLRTLMIYIEKDEECRDAGLKSWRKLLPAIPENTSRDNIPTPLQLKRWRAAFDTDSTFGYRNYVAFSLMMSCGIRIGELSTLRMEHLKLDAKEIFVEGKGRNGRKRLRTVSITAEAVRLLKGWLKRRDRLAAAKTSEYVFVGKRGERCEENGFGQVFRKMRKANPDLAKVSAHIVRHSFGTYYMRNGGQLPKLQIEMGHENIRTTSKYLHLAQVGSEQMKEELEKVNPLKMLDGVRG